MPAVARADGDPGERRAPEPSRCSSRPTPASRPVRRRSSRASCEAAARSGYSDPGRAHLGACRSGIGDRAVAPAPDLRPLPRRGARAELPRPRPRRHAERHRPFQRGSGSARGARRGDGDARPWNRWGPGGGGGRRRTDIGRRRRSCPSRSARRAPPLAPAADRAIWWRGSCSRSAASWSWRPGRGACVRGLCRCVGGIRRRRCPPLIVRTALLCGSP